MERYREIMDDWEAFQEALERPLPTVIRTNTLRIEPAELRHRLTRKGFDLQPLPWDPTCFQVRGEIPIGNTLEHWLGYFYVQEATQLFPVKALDPQPGERLLDLCAAPGGKTTQVAQHMKDEGLVVANDASAKRIQALLANVYRLGVRCVVVTECPGEQFPGRALFDRVLVDAPCSAEGVARRYPHLRQGAALGTIQRLAALQKASDAGLGARPTWRNRGVLHLHPRPRGERGRGEPRLGERGCGASSLRAARAPCPGP